MYLISPSHNALCSNRTIIAIMIATDGNITDVLVRPPSPLSFNDRYP